MKSFEVKGFKREVVGKLGHFAMLKALGPQSTNVDDMHSISQVGLSQDYVSFMMDDMGFWESNVCHESKSILVKDIMHPVKENIDENASFDMAVKTILKFHALSLPVTRGREVVGVLRLTELFKEVTRTIKEMEC